MGRVKSLGWLGVGFLAVLTILFAIFLAYPYFSSNYSEATIEDLYVGVLTSKDEAKVLEMPFVKQKPYYCSEASASMVLQYYGFQISQDEVHDEGYEYFEKMLPLLQRYLDAEYHENFSLEEVKAQIDSGNPVILRILAGSYKHSVVVVGYDEKYIYIHDPAVGPYLKAKPEILVKLWDKTGRLAITLKPKS